MFWDLIFWCTCDCFVLICDVFGFVSVGVAGVVLHGWVVISVWLNSLGCVVVVDV